MTAKPHGETILIVEDAPAILHLIRSALDGEGYRLIEAHNNQEALAVAADHRGPIDLLVTDVVRPSIAGFVLGERLVESRPETRVLLLTGYADQSETTRGERTEASQAFLLQASAHDCLLRTIRDRLAAAPGSGRMTSVEWAA